MWKVYALVPLGNIRKQRLLYFGIFRPLPPSPCGPSFSHKNLPKIQFLPPTSSSEETSFILTLSIGPLKLHCFLVGLFYNVICTIFEQQHWQQPRKQREPIILEGFL